MHSCVSRPRHLPVTASAVPTTLQRVAPTVAPRHRQAACLRGVSLLVRRDTARACANKPPPPPPPLSPRLLLARRLALVAITLKVVLFTPAAAVHQSLLLAFLGTALASRDWWLMSTHLPAVLGSKALSHGAVVATGVAIYILAGLCEIGGGWLVWNALRSGKPRWWAALGSLALVAYGFVAALQPQAAFGRAFALYGGYFVIMSVAWGAVLDGFRPDRGDFVGCALVVAGIIVMTAWPRGGASPAG